GRGYSLEVSYLFSRAAHVTRNRDVNQFKVTGPPSLLNGQKTFIRFPTAAQVAAGLTSDFRNPLRLQDNVYESSANAFYHAGTIQLNKRFANHYGINANYTFSKAIDEVTDFNSDFSAQNPLSIRLDRALSAFHQQHRLVVAAVLESPFSGPSTKAKVLGNWTLSPIFIAGSGRPFNLLLGSDANADGRSQSDRPGTAGRNTGQGEPYYNLDLRLARRINLNETRFFEFTFEAFNLFNQTNFIGINNVIGSLPLTSFAARGVEGRAPTQPLGFTAAAPARQLQFGARFTF
ncbi:MAG TPA: TonB-dependent receptor, partial [Blastocatellia bacterium]|nr:TonB-dependent receptor [Blastocatellia bacterium]